MTSVSRDLLALVPIVLMTVGMIFYWRYGFRLAIHAESEVNRLKGRLAMDFATWAIIAGVALFAAVGWQAAYLVR